MTDFKSAFNDGLKAAEKAQAARIEIDYVFADLNQQLSQVTSGKLTIERELLTRPSYLPSLLEPPQKYWALTARNPLAKSSSKELCYWDSDRAGYPCKLTWGGQEHYCEDKQALENTLSDLLRDPTISEIMRSVINIKSKTK